MQLWALLETVERHVTGFDAFSVIVSGRHGYAEVFERFPWARWVKEDVPFQECLERLLSNHMYEFVSFMVDDTVYVGRVDLRRATRVLREDPLVMTYSHRLGLNIDHSYMLDRKCEIGKSTVDATTRMVCVDWTQQANDFAYPTDVSSSTFRQVHVYKWYRLQPMPNPNQFEESLCRWAEQAGKPRLCFELTSKAYSIPANAVQTYCRECRVEHDPEQTPDMLLVRFRAGYRIDTTKLPKVSNSVHMPLKYVIKKCHPA